jgi:hypothetical protein
MPTTDLTWGELKRRAEVAKVPDDAIVHHIELIEPSNDEWLDISVDDTNCLWITYGPH